MTNEITPSLMILPAGNNKYIARIKGSLTTEIIEKLNVSKFDGLAIDQGEYSDLSPLLKFESKIKRLSLNSIIFDFDTINQFKSLESLYVGEYVDGSIEFSKLKNLKFLELHINSKCKKLSLDLNSLEALMLVNLSSINMDFMKCFDSLRYLRIVQAKKLESLLGISKYKNLEFLEVEKCQQLSDISDLKNCNDLKYLKMSGCKKLTDYSLLSDIKNLEELTLIAKTQNLSWMRKLKKIQVLRFDCDLDEGNLDFLYDINTLQSVVFNNKKNFSLKLDDVHKVLKSRGYEQNGLQQKIQSFPSGLSFI